MDFDLPEEDVSRLLQIPAAIREMRERIHDLEEKLAFQITDAIADAISAYRECGDDVDSFEQRLQQILRSTHYALTRHGIMVSEAGVRSMLKAGGFDSPGILAWLEQETNQALEEVNRQEQEGRDPGAES